MPSVIEPRRGDVVRVGLDPVVGSEQAGKRPAVVISANFINERSPVVLVALITSRKTERIYSFEVLIEPPEGGLTARSKIMLLHLRSLDKARIVSRYGVVEEETMRRIEDALRLATGLRDV